LYLNASRAHENLWMVEKIVLLLSHEQPSVERGFSVNKNDGTILLLISRKQNQLLLNQELQTSFNL